MRLMNVETRELEEFFGDSIPPYAILSHTWGRDEVTFQDLATEDHKRKHGYRKIEGCCQAADEQRIQYVWVDSCCIDKSSSAELSEAINSMFKWYEISKVCFIYLEDVPAALDPFDMDSAFRKSRWWTRGWTLQELLASHHTIFFDSTWARVFTPEMSNYLFKRTVLPNRSEAVEKRPKPKSEDGIQKLMEQMTKRPQPQSEDGIQKVMEQIRYGLVTEITGIPGAVLAKELPLSSVSAACKFAWASQRMTTRTEDKAYCLMGLLGVNMPLLYGEGDQAFVRLQEAVISRSDDISLLAWGYGLNWEDIEELGYDKILARSPSSFREYPKSNYRLIRRPAKTHSTVTGHGLHIELPLLHINARHRVWIGIIEDRWDETLGQGESTALVLRQRSSRDTHIFERARGCPVLRLRNLQTRKWLFRRPVSIMVYLQGGETTSASLSGGGIFNPPQSSRSLLTFMNKRLNIHQYTAELGIFIGNLRNIGYRLSSRYPPMEYDMTSLFSREASKWELRRGQIKIEYESPFENLLCQGPGNELFYFILTNAQGHRVVIRARIKFKSPYIDSYKVDLCHGDSERNTTALEYACGSLGTRDATMQLHKKLQWNSYVNLWSRNQTKIHITACPNQQQLSKKNARCAPCSLVWSGGWVSEASQDIQTSE
ncbi:heterokaryon incompatibility protein-domain-containing protein [Clohesyomyces aquaticus]|uniref:Heterokaryon incompatibility protein-domain-containing protein n=1 Tax=Clohesyomyces aquaticus TaxID=1231657 RepID=A0A1Y1ZGM5_9PLEO|nr:heterokaryon incompatibility protein-domain-containing protein [Clohesyomyces aquaticus]